MPSPAGESMMSVPVPLKVKSSSDQITASTPSSANSPPLARVFSVPSASVMKTLSACRTSMAAESEQVMLTPFSTSCTFSSSFTSTTIWPSSSVPDST